MKFTSLHFYSGRICTYAGAKVSADGIQVLKTFSPDLRYSSRLPNASNADGQGPVTAKFLGVRKIINSTVDCIQLTVVSPATRLLQRPQSHNPHVLDMNPEIHEILA